MFYLAWRKDDDHQRPDILPDACDIMHSSCRLAISSDHLGGELRALFIRWITSAIAVFLVTWGLPKLVPTIDAPIKYGNGYDDWTTLLIFAGVLALVNTFIKPVLQILSLPITCLTAGLFALVINVVMFFLAAWLTSMFNRNVEVGWLGAIVGAIAVAIVGLVVNMVLPD